MIELYYRPTPVTCVAQSSRAQRNRYVREGAGLTTASRTEPAKASRQTARGLTI